MNLPIGTRLRELRQRLGLKQDELAERTRRYAEGRSVQEATLSRIENGKNEPAAWMLSALAQALNTTTDYLLGLTDDPGAAAGAGLPVPAPGLADIVAWLNDLEPLHRRDMVMVMDGMRVLLDHAIAGRPTKPEVVSGLAGNWGQTERNEQFARLWNALSEDQQAQMYAELEALVAAKRRAANG